MYKLIKYRSVELSDLDILYNWENDDEVMNFGLTNMPLSKHFLIKYIQKANLDIQTTQQYRFIIENNSVVIGCIDIFEFDAIHRRAGIGILIDKKYRNKGFGFLAINFISDYAFKKLNLNQIYCSISTKNTSSLKLFKKSGFIEIGLKKNWLYKNGNFVDVIDFQKFKT